MPAQPLRSPASDVPILLREMAGSVAVLTLNRPAARNSLSDSLIAELHAALNAFRQPKVLAGKRVLLTAGPTYEPIDPVRGITNLSSGKMGFALAQAAAEAGAEVTVVAGPSNEATPAGVTRIDVRSAAEMAASIIGRSSEWISC